MTVDQVLSKLESRADPAVKERNRKGGAGENFGVKMGDIRSVAKEIKTNHALAMELWATGNLEARLVAVLILRPKDLTAGTLERMVSEATFTQLADWLNSYVVKKHPSKDAVGEAWMDSSDPMLARSGWSLMAEKISELAGELDMGALLERLEREMPSAPAPVQWTMNFTLVNIGIHSAPHRERALEIGERLGIYRDYPVSKGCTSPFAPIWIREMVKRQGQLAGHERG